MDFRQRLALLAVRTKFWFISLLSARRAAAAAFRLFCTPRIRTVKPLTPVFQEAEKLEFPFEGYIIRGYRWNHPSPKKALILHGFESSVTNFEQYVLPLTHKGYEVLAFDAPAHGRSSGKTITVLLYQQMVRYIQQQYGPFQAFIAHSFGGLALTLALEELPHDPSTKIALIAPAAETKTAADNYFRLLRLGKRVRIRFDALIQTMGGHPIAWYSVCRAADKIKAEVLFLQDKKDELTPYSDVVPIMEKNLPNFHFVITEGLGHRKIYRDEAIFNTIIGFL